MILLYNLLLIIFYPFYLLLTLLHPKIREFHITRKEGKKRIIDFINLYKNHKKIWLHASSAGELDQALAIFRILKHKHPDIPILITVFSLSVKNIDKLPSEGKAYLPMDFIWQWKFKNANFIFFITFTWDTFPNLLRTLKKDGCKNFLCSAAIEHNSYRIKYSSIFRFFYNDFAGIGVVDEYNYANFKKLYNKNLQITGDSRYDTIIYKLEHQTISPEDNKKLQMADSIIIFASTYKECDQELYPYINKLLNELPEYKIWIFPHHIDENRIQETIKYLNHYNIEKILLFSNENFINEYPKNNIIIVDKLGILAFAYQYSKICYVGGAFHHRVHNTGEPAACGCIPFTGPNINSSPVALLLGKNQLLFKYENGNEIITNMIRLIKNKKELNKKSIKIKTLIQKQTGASEKFYNVFLKNYLKKDR